MIQHRWGLELIEGRASKVGYERRPVIRTARTEGAINRAVAEGFFPLVKLLVRNSDVHVFFGVEQDSKTGLINVLRDVTSRASNVVIDTKAYYPYNFPSVFAAYLIPDDLVPGDKVWMEDLIEDIVAVRFKNGYPRLACAPAIWNGKEFEIQYDPAVEVDDLMA